MNGMDRGYKITIMGSQVYYEHFKPRKTTGTLSFVLIHGFMASTFSFRKMIPILAKDYEVFALDLVGFGKSEKNHQFEYSYLSYAKLAVEFIKKMELRNAIVVGHSMGGQIALHAARQSPEWVKALILVGCCSYLDKAPFFSVLLSYFPFSRRLVRWWMNRYEVKDILKNTLYHDALIDREMIQAYEQPLQDKNFAGTLIGLLRHREGDLCVSELQKVRQPVLLIWGEEDQIVPLRTGLRMRQDLSHSHFISIPDAGHQVIEEKPVEVIKGIEKWLANSSWNDA